MTTGAELEGEEGEMMLVKETGADQTPQGFMGSRQEFGLYLSALGWLRQCASSSALRFPKVPPTSI